MGDEPRSIRVLLVEDNPHVAELVTDGLEVSARRELGGRVEFVFDVCGDGQAALGRLEAATPDLIILDVYMPIMDGAQFLRHLRAHPRAQKTPVLALSAGGAAARRIALEAGADEYLDKPIRLAEVLRLASKLLHLGA
jgi:CheY-like chemotaxis protein